MPEQLRAFNDGTLDVCQLFEPYVSEALADGESRMLYSACDRGPTVYTTFIASRNGLSRHRTAFIALTRALQNLQNWIYLSGPETLADVVAPFFPDIPVGLLRSSIQRYHRGGVWALHPAVSRAGFARLAGSLHAGGFITAPGDYESCVHRFEEPTIPRLSGS